ncbi:MAG: ATP-binding protein [Polyangiales bacterium]
MAAPRHAAEPATPPPHGGAMSEPPRSPPTDRPPFARPVVAIGWTLAALAAITLLKHAAFGYLGVRTPYLLYFVAILVAAWQGGWPAGFVATFASAFLGSYYFIPPFRQFSYEAGNLGRAAMFVTEGVMISLVAARAQNDRYRAQRAARDAEHALARLEGVLRSIGDAVIATDLDGRVTFANPHAESLTGWSRDQVEGKPLREVLSVVDESTGAPVEPAPPAALDDEPSRPSREHAVVSRAGARVSVDDAVAPIRTAGGELVGSVLVMKDVSRTRAEERTRAFVAQATAELVSSLDYRKTLATVARLAVPAVGDWCAVDVLEGDALHRLVIEHVDPAKAELLYEIDRRYPPDPKAPSGRYAALRSDAPIFVQDFADAAIEAMGRDEGHRALLRRLGARSYISVRMVAHGAPVGVLTLATGESGRRYTDDDVRLVEALADRASLASANARLFDEVARTRTEAERANRAKDEFLAMLGHELRNPLAPILTALQLMRLRGDAAFERERAIVERQVKHVVALVDDLLDVSRITRGKIDLALETVEVADAVAKALELAGPLIEERHHAVRLSVPRGLYVEADPVRLAQVVSNLLTNAAKYTDPGGHIEVRAAREDHTVTLSVKDDGVGIDAELLPNVFGLFVQGGQSIDRSKGGLGLGLGIVKNVVALHRGTVEALSEGVGRGSEFRVRLPAAPSPSSVESSSSATSLHPPAGDGARVLVVDDNADAAELLAEALQMLGHEVYTAPDPAEALAIAPVVRPQVALLDIGLPVMDGYELAGRLRALPELEGCRYVAVTGYGQPADKARARAAGFDEHLVKPVSIDDVQRVVTKLLA